jgi:hypothetical protein
MGRHFSLSLAATVIVNSRSRIPLEGKSHLAFGEERAVPLTRGNDSLKRLVSVAHFE